MKDIIYLIIIVLLVAATVTMSVLYAKLRAEKKEAPSYYDQKCAAFALENANLSEGQIVFIGDSITDGYRLNNYYNDLPLATYNRGIGGDVTAGVINRLKLCLYDLKPTKIVLMIGINDINSGVTDEQLKANYETILAGIKQNLPTTEVFCLSILPMQQKVEAYGVNLTTATARIKAMNGEIQTLAAAKGYHYVDLYTPFSDGNDRMIESYSDDGLHPNTAGYVAWTSVLKPLLQ